MKKLSIISNQIKNNTYSYTGKGSFEAVVNNNKELIKQWLEELIPLQKQIELLNEKENIDFQKRNYTRILTKVFPEEYKEFVSLNILVRDSNIIAKYYGDEFNITILYNKLIENKHLKYPGKYDKYVDFELFQKFVMMYREDLVSNQENEVIEVVTTETVEENIIIEKESSIEKSNEKIKDSVSVVKKETNWTNLLLGKLK
ncbi:MAG: hypothetical protein U9R16_06680 [Campylobacterota bacterium]|nr:hypothetical protein [Campylobacterota bacterium]